MSNGPRRQRRRVDDDALRPRYTVGVVAARLGVPTATLRSWNLRYGVGPTGHSPGRHRLYSDTDIAVVEAMRELIDKGVNPATAARAALDVAVPAGPDLPALLTAVFDLNVKAASAHLLQYVRHRGVVETWEHLVRPAFAVIDERQRDGVGCIDVEHALSWTVSHVLQRLPMTATKSSSIILACSEGEQHNLALEALRAALGELGCDALMLGADVPATALVDAIGHRPPPVTVVIWAQTRRTADAGAARAVVRADAQLMVGGPGWASARLPRNAVRLDSLPAALRQLTET